MNNIYDDVTSKSIDLAKTLGHGAVLLDHLFLVLLSEYDETEALLSRVIPNLNVKKLKNDIKQSLDNKLKKSTKAAIDSPILSLSFSKVMNKANMVRKSRLAVTVVDIINQTLEQLKTDEIDAPLDRKPNECHPLFKQITIESLVNNFSGMADGKQINQEDNAEATPIDSGSQSSQSRNNLLKLKWEVSPQFSLHGRDDQYQTLIHTLNQSENSFAVIVGDAYDGKTSLINELAARIKLGDVPEQFKGKVIYSVNSDKIAGYEYHRQNLASAISLAKNAKAILVIENTHQFEKTMSEHNSVEMLCEAANDGLKIICTTSHRGYSRSFEKGQANEKFTKIILDPLTLPKDKDLILDITEDKMALIEASTKLTFSSECYDNVLTIASDNREKSALSNIFKVIVRAASIAASKPDSAKEITMNDIRHAISEIRNIPLDKLNISDTDKIRTIESKLKETIFGQDEAIKKIVESIEIAEFGLKENPMKPNGIFMFLGSTGVGKTEASLQLASAQDRPLIRLDMGEFSESQSSAKLLGAPAGYIGYSDGDGMLHEKLQKNPNSIILVDEIEKAHPKVRQLWLGALDHGVMTSGSNKVIDFSQATIIFTTNAGIVINSNSGFGLAASKESDKVEFNRELYEKTFSPEFRNRLDYEILFNAITPEVALPIANKSAEKLKETLSKQKNIDFVISKDALKIIANKYHSKENGARQIVRGFTTDVTSKIPTAINDFIKAQGKQPKKVSVSCKSEALVIKAA